MRIPHYIIPKIVSEGKMVTIFCQHGHVQLRVPRDRWSEPAMRRARLWGGICTGDVVERKQ